MFYRITDSLRQVVYCYSTWGGTYFVPAGRNEVHYCAKVVLQDGDTLSEIEKESTQLAHPIWLGADFELFVREAGIAR